MEEREKVSIKSFPKSFWAVNTMEIFERMAWYGFFAVSSIYMTDSIADGGLGFSDEDRGVLQGVVTFFLYLFPVVTGAIADRFGYKKTLFAAFLVLVPAYYMLGQFKTFPTFFIAFMIVAVGAAIFKPVVLATITKVTNKDNASMGFGIFYMMVNIGGFIGPIVAGVIRGWSWNYVFIMSSVWIALNFIIVTFFFDEPKIEGEKENKKSLGEVMSGMVEVLGNGRFFAFIFGILFVLVLGSKYTSGGNITWNDILLVLGVWVGINVIYDIILKSINSESKVWLFQPMKLGNWKFGLFLLVLSGFWTSFNQIFITLPLYIRDFVDTSDILSGFMNFLNSIGLSSFADSMNDSMAVKGQMNPEYMINFNAGAIIVFQVFISYLVTRMKPFSTIFWGVMITVVSFSVMVFGHTGWIVLLGIIVFSFGEMMASPKSKEYTGSIAPPDKVALYMGYFYWCIALGNLFAGILSGQLYGQFARDMQRPDIMWWIFAGLALFSAIAVFFYDRLVIKKMN